MNKFVKGAKNLAFALSFVTIAACGGVKKADLETLEKSFNEKIGGKADKDSCVSKNELASLKSEIGNEVGEKIKSGVEGLKKETVRLDVLDKAFVKNPTKFVELFGAGVELSEGVLKGSEIVLSGFEDKGKCCFEVKGGEKVFVKKKELAAVLTDEDLDVLMSCVAGGSGVKWESDFVLSDCEANSLKFNGKTIDLEKKDELVSLIVLLELGLKANKTFGDLKFGGLKITADKIGNKNLKTGDKEEVKMLVDVLNRYNPGCCIWDESGSGKVTFVKGKGWTSDGNKVISENVDVALKS